MHNHKIDIKEINSQSELIEILPEWKKLNNICQNYNLFKDPQWALSWINTFWQKNWHLKVLTAWYNNELIAIAPIYYQQGNSILSIKNVYPIGQGETEDKEISTEYLEILFNEKYQEHLLPKFQQWILSINADQLNWNALLHHSPTKSILINHKQIRSHEATRYIVDGSSWAPEKLSKNMRSRYRRGLNQLDKLNAKIGWVQQCDFDHYWQSMKGFHQQRWLDKNKKGAFCSDEFNKFHAEFRQKSPKNVAMSAVWVNNKAIAIHYYFLDATTLYFYQSGWNEHEYSKLSPGLILHLWTIENNNKPYYDFMRGEKHDSYKAKFATEQQPMHNITVNYSPIKLMIHRLLKKSKLVI